MQAITRLLLLFVFFSFACTSKKKSSGQKKEKAHNIIVLLDLSDRLTLPGQVNRDTLLLRQIYTAFEERVRKQMYINAQDQLQVLVAPQRSLPAHTETIENRLRINMQEVPVKERSGFLKKKRPVFFQQVDSLYHAAAQRPASSFSGSDIWKFFDQYLRNYLVPDTNTENRIIVLTDGYFDFESLKDKKQQGCRYSYSEKLMQKGRVPVPGNMAPELFFQQIFDSCGLIPVHINQGNTGILVAEMTARNSYEYELELLEAMWSGWYNTMGIGYISFVRKNDVETVKRKLSQFIIQPRGATGR